MKNIIPIRNDEESNPARPVREVRPGPPLTRHEAAERSGLSVRSIDRLVADGTLPARKFKRAVRIDRAGFERWMEGAWKRIAVAIRT